MDDLFSAVVYDEDEFDEFDFEDNPKDFIFDEQPQNENDFAHFHVAKYFQDKSMHCGGKIPKYLLRDAKRFDAVLKLDIIAGVELAYKFLADLITPEDERNVLLNGDSTIDIKMVTSTLNQLSKSGVPQQFAGGMLLMHLEFIEGIKIDYSNSVRV